MLWAVLSAPDVYYYYRLDCYAYVFYVLCLYYVVVYVLDVVLSINKWVALFVKPIVFGCSAFMVSVDIYFRAMYKTMMSRDYIQIIAETNWNEAIEYIDSIVTWPLFVLFILCVIGFFILGVVLTRTHWTSRFGRIFGICALFISAAAIVHNSAVVNDVFSGEDRWSSLRLEEVVDMSQHLTNPQIEETMERHPQNIVVIIGESAVPSRYSLYGHNRATNPLLENDSIIIFKNVVSPEAHTTETFRYLLNTYQKGMEEGKKFYESTSVIEALNKAGYQSIWISNQSRNGIYDNLPSGHSKLCGKQVFVNEAENATGYDGDLLKVNVEQGKRNFIIYHLMGQHPAFKSRYPADFKHFSEEDYADSPKQQRHNLADYDNATLYNDYVLYSIIEKYKDGESIVFYLSDHGLDFYDTDPNYAGHAKATEESKAFGKKIPFMVYVSPSYQQHFPEKVESIKANRDTPYCTDKLTYTLMDVAGFRFAGNDDVAKYTLFSSR